MIRFPEIFYITPQIETREGSDFVYSNDPTRERIAFRGSIKEAIVNGAIATGDIARTTHVIHCRSVVENLQIGITIEQETGKFYEVLFFITGQNNTKIWVAYSY